MDTWISLRNFESNGERTRGLYVLKSRGMSHSNQVREFVLSDEGIRLVDVYVGPDGIVTGTSRELQQVKDKALCEVQREDINSKLRELDRKRDLLAAKIAAMQAEFDAEQESMKRGLAQQEARNLAAARDRATIENARQGSASTGGTGEAR